MLHPHIHVVLHQNQHRERLKQADNERLVQLVSQPTSHMQSLAKLSGLISKWWTQRWRSTEDNRLVEGEVVTP